MKQLSTAMTAAVAGGVLAGSLVLGLGIRAVRTRDAKPTEPVKQQQQVQANAAAQPGQPGQPAGQDPGPRPSRRGGFGGPGGGTPMGFGGNQDEMRQRWENMTEDQRAAFRDQMRQRFGGRGGRRGGMGQQQLSPEVQARVDEIRANMDSMSDEEKAKAREEIMQLTGGNRMMGRRGGGGGDEFVFRSLDPAEAEALRAKWPNMTDEEKQKYRDEARQKFEQMRQQQQNTDAQPPQPQNQ